MGKRRAVIEEEKGNARTSCKGLEINVVSYKYRETRKKEETNLVAGGVEVEDGAGELGLDDVVPKPLHGRAKGDVGRIGRSRATGKEGNELALGADDERSRVPTSGERTGVVVGVDCCLDRVEGAEDAIAALMRFEPSKTTDGCERSVAAFDDKAHGVALEVLVVGFLDRGGGKNGYGLVEAILRIVERRLDVITRIHETHELARLNFRAWNTDS